MSDDFILERVPNNCGLEASSSSSVSECNIGLQYQNEPITGGSIIQSSPPHYRHSRAYRHFKNPPQPHMCIRTTTEHGEELFINVLSWTRIVIPQEPTDPIPLYGGMRVPPGSPRSPPIVFAVMANPEVLKDSGRHSKDPEERRAMVELMCDFVEAMNPGIKLIRNAIILKDRDISGELKDVWNAVQVQRDREREEQIVQQRQQHFHNTTTQQLFPKVPNSSVDELQNEQLNNLTDIYNTTENKRTYTQFTSDQTGALKGAASNELTTDGTICHNESDQAVALVHEGDQDNSSSNNSSADIAEQVCLESESPQVNNVHNTRESSVTSTDSAPKSNNIISETNGNNKSASTNMETNTNPTTTNKTSTAPTKKEKLGGFLPNGCIFPRFKNNKHKDKDKDNSKSTSKEREKNLLHVLKKNKDKQEDQTKNNFEKNCIQLETEVEKLDLNKIDSAASNDNMFMKLKIATSAAK